MTYISDDDSNYSSYVESSVQSTCESPLSSAGYRESCESSLSASTLYTRSPKSADDWIIISAELSCKEDSDWLLVSPRTIAEARSFGCTDVSQIPSCKMTDDWTILSVHVNSRKWHCGSGKKTDSSRSTPSSGIRRQLFQSPKSEPCSSSSLGFNRNSTDRLSDSATFTGSTTDSMRTQTRETDYLDMQTEESEKEDWIIITYKGS